jgi:hypothetical protein
MKLTGKYFGLDDGPRGKSRAKSTVTASVAPGAKATPSGGTFLWDDTPLYVISMSGILNHRYNIINS